MTILNVEADEILYRSCFASQQTAYIVETLSGKQKDFGTKYKKRELIDMLKRRDKHLDVDYYLHSYQEVEPIEYCLATIKRTLKRLQQYGELQLWLSPSDKSNFRFNVAKTEGPKGDGYKAGRQEKPVHYEQAREYLIKVWKAEEIHGYEADDALGIYQHSDSVAVHIDKDINIVAGKHMNWLTGEQYYVKGGIGELEMDGNSLKKGGLKFFFAQMLMGDSIDNIPGIKGIGPKIAFNLINPLTTTKECLKLIIERYKKQYGDNYKSVLLEIADLLWIVQEDGVTGRQVIKNIAKGQDYEIHR